MKYIRTALSSLAIAALLLAPAVVFSAASVSAQDTVQNALCDGATNLQINDNSSATDCATATNNSTDKVNKTIKDIINIFSTIVGVVAVIMIIWGGLRYITSGGDSGKISNAKNTIIYALIGLIVVALAQFIVKFVLNKATTP
ncbi:hypothetical protein CSA80_03730 [Candidatus Saccharibacteria bacterium]|nr:MAG: hypothetical protein CR973_01220 [Candidatus Saccharibacteria bacterium]PID99196.1 MAG: hypothetical protein CSA80_03730 [Candidatus Saccharibacteria bacterium]